MGKRGRKGYKDAPEAHAMPFARIAARLGVSTRTVASDFKSGMRKLKAIPGAYEILLEEIQERGRSQIQVLRAGGVECRTDVRSLYCDGASNWERE
jgi:hypothetical protein